MTTLRYTTKFTYGGVNGSDEQVDLPFYTSTSGRSLGEPKTADKGSYRGELVASDDNGAIAVVYNWSFAIADRDTDVPRFGPNGKACENGAKVVDGTEFDQSFTCTCVEGYIGPNCEILITQQAAASSESSDTSLYAIVATLAAIVVAALVFVAVTKHRARVKANAPMDFETKMAMLKELGLIDPEKDGDELLLPRELRRTWLQMISELGKGAFGEVWKCTLTDTANNVPE